MSFLFNNETRKRWQLRSTATWGRPTSRHGRFFLQNTEHGARIKFDIGHLCVSEI